ncbi:MAG TPA: substrate-binding domain-containing protein, partial [Cytophagaceae bacterium]
MPEFSSKLLIFLIALTIAGCSPQDQENKESEQVVETPVSGVLPLYTDPAFYPFIKSEITTFEALYPKANIEPVYAAEGLAVNNFIEKKVSTIIIGRNYKEEELKVLGDEGFAPTSNIIARDALAFIVNQNFKDSL